MTSRIAHPTARGRWHRRLATLGALLAALAWALPAADARAGGPGSGGHGPGHGPPVEWVIERMTSDLGLDAETTARLEALAEEGRAERERLRTALRQEHEAMRSLLEQPAPDEGAVMERAEAIGALETQARKARLRTLLAARAALTPEQRERWAGLREARRAAHREQLTKACGGDLATLCPQADPGRETVRCLRMHRDDLSARCAEALRSHRPARPMGGRSGPPPR